MALAAEQASVTTTATALTGASPGVDASPKTILIKNATGTATVFLGGADITTGTGYSARHSAFNANDDPYDGGLFGTSRNRADGTAYGTFRRVLATVDGPERANVGAIGSVEMADRSGWAWGVAATVRSDRDYSTEEGLWGAEFDICVRGYDAENKFSGDPQSTGRA